MIQQPVAELSFEDFIRSVCDRFADDPSSPSFVLSWLPTEERWYAGFHRFGAPYGGGRMVAAKATEPRLDAAISQLVANVKEYMDAL